jgi:transcriptional regulator with XRE-family HTH domain
MKRVTERRILSSSLSQRVIEYLRAKGHSQARIARMLGVSQPFISLVKSRERSLTLDHLELLSSSLGVPLGALMFAVTNVPKRNKKNDAVHRALGRLLKMSDQVHEAILRAQAGSSRG